MLTIRMQRTGRKGYASFRIVVQDSRFSPSSGRVVAKIGHYNPHTKETVIEKEKAVEYLKNGAKPSPRVVRLFQAEKIALPDWVETSSNDKKRKIRNPEKLRKDQPKEESVAEEVIAEEIKEELAEITDEIVAEEIAEVLEAEVVEKEAEKIVEAEEKTVEA
jgi:small subunit ribosomal protein S16